MFHGNLSLGKELSHVGHDGLHCLEPAESRSGSECGDGHSPDTKPDTGEGRQTHRRFSCRAGGTGSRGGGVSAGPAGVLPSEGRSYQHKILEAGVENGLVLKTARGNPGVL